MSGKEFEVSEERAKQLFNLSGLVFVPELNGAINLNSVETILRLDSARQADLKNPKVGTTRKLHDGIIAIKRNGQWVNEYSGNKIDLQHYPELLKDTEEFFYLNEKND